MNNHDHDPRRQEARLKQQAEQDIAGFRHYWEQWSVEDRAAFKRWLEVVATLQQSAPKIVPHVRLMVELAEPNPDGSFDPWYPPIEAMRRAIACWERGEEYDGPDSWVEMK